MYEVELRPFKTVIRKTTKNYHLRADDPLLLKIWTHISTEALKRG